MGAQQGAVKSDLDGVADELHVDCGSAQSVADPVAGASEADRPVFVDDPQHYCAFGGTCRTGHLRPSIHLVDVVDQMTSGVGRDDNPVVADVQQSVRRLDRDRFAGKVAADVIAVLEDADASGAVDAATNCLVK